MLSRLLREQVEARRDAAIHEIGLGERELEAAANIGRSTRPRGHTGHDQGSWSQRHDTSAMKPSEVE